LPGEGARLVARAIKLQAVEESERTLAAALSALAVHRDEKQIELFERRLLDDRAEVVKAAAAALGEHFGAKESVRKKLAGSLVRAYSASGMTVGSEGTSGAKTHRMGNLEFRIAVRSSFRLALARLTGGVDHGTAENWEAWYRANKGEPWREGVDRATIAVDNIRVGPAPGHAPGGGR
jgi:HEAT repeat protein